ncbi:MAG: flagellar motor switch protein FliN [Treponema sp.]|nr:flagellar motor switch protein FliN [Treponema sp.]
MSDGALSQDEIDALLAGVDSSSLSGGGAPVAAAPAPSLNVDRSALEKFFASTTGALSSNLSALTGATVNLIGPQVSITGRDNFLVQLPEMVTVIAANYTSGFPGEHIFILPEESAGAIASLMTHEEDIQLDEMAMSVIGEVVSQMVGTQITSLTDKTGNKSIAAASPTATNVPKAVAALPGGDFAVMTYQLDLGDSKPHQMWEILGSTPAVDISSGLSGHGSGPAQMPMGQMQGMGNMGGGMNMGSMGMQMPNMGMGMGMMGQGMGMPGMPNLGPTNVQPVQFPNLMQPRFGAQEAGNISLIMDVSMEMTVELGRTRKLIKEILGMGEGTIIELDKLAGEPVDILVNHKLIAKGEVVVIDENFGVRVTEIVSPMERFNDMG